MHKVLLFIILCSCANIFAQFGKNCEIRQIKINLFNPGLEYEMGLGVNSTLDFRVAWQAALEPASIKPLENYDFFPAITVQNRYYHNFNGRDRRGRQIYGNSGNYIAPTIALFSPGERIVENNLMRRSTWIWRIGLWSSKKL